MDRQSDDGGMVGFLAALHIVAACHAEKNGVPVGVVGAPDGKLELPRPGSQAGAWEPAETAKPRRARKCKR
ncbi:MAG: hypothetical protein EPN21_07905 [Methylococcaceae bacterium]|nr:MAG: hypothetical protein EPN21_07905 [Methylococcaceae bacterium]